MDEIEDIFHNNTALMDEPEVREVIERYITCKHVYYENMDRINVLEAALREIYLLFHPLPTRT